MYAPVFNQSIKQLRDYGLQSIDSLSNKSIAQRRHLGGWGPLPPFKEKEKKKKRKKKKKKKEKREKKMKKERKKEGKL